MPKVKKLKRALAHDTRVFQKYQNLLMELTRKNIKLKYRDSWIGILWSFLQPLLNMIVLSVVFSGIFGRSNKGVICYPVFLFTGRLMFDFFTSSTKQAMTSFRRNAGIIKKVYVPKYMYPLSSILSCYVTFAISLLCLVSVWIFFKLTGISNGHALHLNGYAVLFFVPMFILHWRGYDPVRDVRLFPGCGVYLGCAVSPAVLYGAHHLSSVPHYLRLDRGTY